MFRRLLILGLMQRACQTEVVDAMQLIPSFLTLIAELHFSSYVRLASFKRPKKQTLIMLHFVDM